MSNSLECPRCRLQVETRPGLGREPRRCSDCGATLVLANTPREADVRRYLYGHSLIPLSRPLGGTRVRTP